MTAREQTLCATVCAWVWKDCEEIGGSGRRATAETGAGIAVNDGTAGNLGSHSSPVPGNWTQLVQPAHSQIFKGDIAAILIYDRALV